MIFISNTSRNCRPERHERLTKHTPSRNNSRNNQGNNQVKSELSVSGILVPDLHSSSFRDFVTSHVASNIIISSKKEAFFPAFRIPFTFASPYVHNPRRSRVEYSGALLLCSVICCIHTMQCIMCSLTNPNKCMWYKYLPATVSLFCLGSFKIRS
jgi:hypothetical protein